MARVLSVCSLLTYDEVCRACGQATPGPASGDVWESLLDVAERVTDEIESYLERQIVSRGALTEYHTVEARSPLYLGQWPVLSMTSVEEGSGPPGSWSADVALTEDVDYVTDGGLLVRLSGADPTSWRQGHERVRVVYTAGYASTATVPQRFKRVAASLASRMWAVCKRGHADAQSVSDGMGSVTRFLPAELLDMERQALASERRHHTTGRAA